jgi:hypothetical protein
MNEPIQSLSLPRRRAAWSPEFLVLALLGLAAAGCSGPKEDRPVDPDLAKPVLTYKPVAPGVQSADFSRMQPSPLLYHVVRADLRQGGLSLGVLHADLSSGSDMARVGEMALALETPERRVVAAINGDYFDSGMAGPWGIHMTKGRLAYSPQGRSALLIDAQGKPLLDRPKSKLNIRIGDDPAWFDIRDMNRPALGEDPGLHLYAYTPEVPEAPAPKGVALIEAELPLAGGVITGTVTHVITDGHVLPLPHSGLALACGGKDSASQLPPGLREGVSVHIRTEVIPAAWEAVGGGPRIVRDGKVSIELTSDGIFKAETSYLNRHHPRAVVGMAEDGQVIYLVVVRGRCDESLGIRLYDLANLMIGLGAEDAIMFDGGESAAIFENNNYIIQGRDRTRLSYNGLAILALRDTAAVAEGSAP